MSEPTGSITERVGVDGTSTKWITYALAVVVSLAIFTVPMYNNDPYVHNLMAWILILAILTMGYNVLFGYTGMLSFGHAAFFGSGAYTVAFLMHYTQVTGLIPLLLAGTVVGTALAAVFGAVSLRTRDIYYALLMLALAQILYVLAVKLYNITGGTDGLGIGLPTFLGAQVGGASIITYMATFYYYVVALLFFASVVAVWIVLRSSFGHTLKTIRENEARASAMGVPVTRYKLYSTLISGFFPGLAGALYAIQQGYIVPHILDWTYSGQIVFMTLLGGANTFLGPIFGAAIFVLLRSYALDLVSFYWQFIMGFTMFMVVITVGDDGFWGGFKTVLAYARGRFYE
ncbi:MAG: branched-chain amino acid ABC transporter permease [Halanaeroarchaeum sp.]